MGANFEQWISAVFDHSPPGRGEKEWYWGEQFDEFWEEFSSSDDLTIAHLTRLFREPDLLHTFSLHQVAVGIWFLIGESSPAAIGHAIAHPGVSIGKRISCIRAIPDFFRKFVMRAAQGPAKENEDEFHCACYMWWDIFPTWGGMGAGAAYASDTVAQRMGGSAGEVLARAIDRIGEPEIHVACIDAMEQVLQLPTELCQLSALRGLNHWHLHHSARVEKIIDAYLATTTTATPRMREYALSARCGCCQ